MGAQDYLRSSLSLRSAILGHSSVMLPVATPHAEQDSSMLSTLAESHALLVRAPYAPAARAGEPCRIIRLERFC